MDEQNLTTETDELDNTNDTPLLVFHTFSNVVELLTSPGPWIEDLLRQLLCIDGRGIDHTCQNQLRKSGPEYVFTQKNNWQTMIEWRLESDDLISIKRKAL
ncbi:hypothetical protein ARSEF4850_010167, partial [Beauveria asiatica]